jgi:SurA N-terminal domain/PPIC-type PPIASE domain
LTRLRKLVRVRTLKNMFGTIRKHQSWLWGLIITAMILGLVIYFSPNAGMGSGSSSGDPRLGSIDGAAITKDNFLNAQREASLAYFVNSGSWPDSGPQRGNVDMQAQTYQWLFLIHKIKEYNIHVDSEAVAQLANNILQRFGNGQPVPLDVFAQQILMPHGLSANDFERYVRHQLALEQLISVVGLNGDLVTEKEAQAFYIRENQELASQVLFFSGTNYLTSVTAPTPEVIGEFYTNQMSAYRLPERLQVNFVSFDASNYLAEADQQINKLTNLNAIVEQVYQQRGTNFYRDVKSPEEAKQKIRLEMRHEIALGEARKKADGFAIALFDLNPPRAENLTVLAQTNGLKVKITAPFDAQTGPDEFDGGPNFAKEAFKLNVDQPFAGPLVGENGVYVIALARRIPSEVPPLAGIRDRVVADYKRFQAAANARRAGAAFAQTLTNGLAQGKTFAAITADAKLKPVTLPPFSLSTRELPELDDRVDLRQLKQIAIQTQPGQASEFIPTADGGFIFYAQQRLPIDPAKMKSEMPDFLRSVRQARRSETINLWLNREEAKSFRDTLMQQQQQAGGQGKS